MGGTGGIYGVEYSRFKKEIVLLFIACCKLGGKDKGLK